MSHEPNVDRVRAYFDRHAEGYDRGMQSCERRLLGENRQWATSRATGRVLELAAGTGLNFALYPADVTQVVAVELSERMCALAQHRIDDAGWTRCTVQLGDVQRLSFPDGSFDTVLSTYSLCTIPDPATALREAARVLQPGGRLVLVDHGPAARRTVLWCQRLVNPLCVRLQSDNLLRDPPALTREAGFRLLESRRAGWSGTVYLVHAETVSA